MSDLVYINCSIDLIDLRVMYNKVDGTRILLLHHYIYHVTQGTLSITTYFGMLKILRSDLIAIGNLVLVCEVDNSLRKEK